MLGHKDTDEIPDFLKAELTVKKVDTPHGGENRHRKKKRRSKSTVRQNQQAYQFARQQELFYKCPRKLVNHIIKGTPLNSVESLASASPVAIKKL